jgi:carotenoid cleavage dioxygenase
VVSFVTDMKADRCECVVLGARDLAAGPVARILLPHRISSCTHACRAEASEIGTSSGLTRSRHAA